MLLPSRRLIEAEIRKIYFTLTNDSDRVSRMARCSILSACLMNPDMIIVLISQIKVDPNVTGYCTNVVSEVASFDDILIDTPLYDWYHNVARKDDKNFKADLSDALRTAIMWKRGGAYFDADVISVKPLLTGQHAVPINSLGKQLAGMDKKGRVPYVNGAVMVFEAKNPYIEEVMNSFTLSYRHDKFGTVGPDLLWSVYKRFSNHSDYNWLCPQYVNSSSNILNNIGLSGNIDVQNDLTKEQKKKMKKRKKNKRLLLNSNFSARRLRNNSSSSALHSRLFSCPLNILEKDVFYPIKFRAFPLKVFFVNRALQKYVPL